MKTLTIIAAFLVLTATGFAQDEGAQIVELPVSGVFYNECCDEVVEVTGVARIVLRDGFTLNNSHLTLKGATGTGSNGGSYTQKAASTQNISVQDNGSYTSVFQLKMVNDEGCSFTIHLVQKMQMDANGNVTVEFEKYSITCE